MSAQPAEGTTGTATILFTDLVDLTAQRARLGEETAEGCGRATIARCSPAPGRRIRCGRHWRMRGKCSGCRTMRVA